MANKVKSSLPKYIAIFDSIVERIKSGNLKVGDRVPSENELIADFNISNTTARKVLQELQNKAWVRRIKGSGTFVMKAHSEKIERELASFEAICGNFSDNLTRDGFAPKVKVIEKKIIKGGIEIDIGRKTYSISSNALHIRCLRYAGNELLKDENKYISLELCPSIADTDGDVDPIMIFYKRAKLEIGGVYRSLSADLSNPTSKDDYFGSKSPLPLILLEGATLTSSNEVLEIEKSKYRGNKYKFSLGVNP